MRVSVVPGRELTPDVLSAWSAIQRDSPGLDSPYFAPGFVQAAALVRDDVEVAIVDDGAPAFFPFQRRSRGVAVPVGGRFSDFHGVVARDVARIDPVALLRGARLGAWRFDHLVAAQEPFRRYLWAEAPSPFVDLSGGFEAYRASRRRAGSREIEQLLYKARKARRHAGELRLDLHTTDDAAFHALVRWKRDQLRAAGQPSLLELGWAIALLERIRRADAEGFSGLLSALYLGDRLAAVHLGMRSRAVLHWWLPAYDPALAKHTPGQLCFLELARAAARAGVTRIDLGKGEEPYKTRLMSGAIAVAEGAVDLRPFSGPLHRSWYRAAQWARRSPLRKPLLAPARWVRRVAYARTDR